MRTHHTPEGLVQYQVMDSWSVVTLTVTAQLTNGTGLAKAGMR